MLSKVIQYRDPGDSDLASAGLEEVTERRSLYFG